MRAALVFAFLGLVAPARAEVVGTSRYVPPTGPALTAGGAAWADDRGAVHAGDTTVFTGDAPAGRIVADGDQLGVETVLDQPGGKYSPGTFETRSFTGPASGPLTWLRNVCSGLGGLDVEAGAIAFLRQSSTGYRPCHLVVREADGRERELPERSTEPRLAGTFAAYLQSDGEDGPGTLTVIDRATGTDVLRLDPRYIRTFALRDDGAVVFGASSGGLQIASPAEPQPRTVVPRVQVDAVRVVGDRAVFQADRGYRSPPAPIRTVDLSTGVVRSLGLRAFGFDFDGERLAWLQRGCVRVRVVVASLEAPAPPVSRCPPVRIVGRPYASRTGRRAYIEVSGAGTYRNSEPDFLRIATTRRPHRSVLIRGHDSSVYGPDGTVSVALTAAAGRRLRAGRTLRVRAIVRIGDQRRRTLAFTLRR